MILDLKPTPILKVLRVFQGSEEENHQKFAFLARSLRQLLDFDLDFLPFFSLL